MSEQEVVELMPGAVSETDWNSRCDQVKETCGGYPGFWYSAVIMSGVMAVARSRWAS